MICNNQQDILHIVRDTEVSFIIDKGGYFDARPCGRFGEMDIE